jgi:hypothetical protein
LLGTIPGVAINASGWITADISGLDIDVTAGNYYGFILKPQFGLNANIGSKNGNAYPAGDSWVLNGNGYNSFNGGDDCPFKVNGNFVASQINYTPGESFGLMNFTDQGFANQYQELGQTFHASAAASLTRIDFYIENLNNAGDVNMELYYCNTQNSWDQLLGTKTNITITGPGWYSVDISSLNLSVISGNNYGFKLIPQDGLNASAGSMVGNVYTGGQSWVFNGNGYNAFDEGHDFPFKVFGNSSIVLPVKFISFTANRQSAAVLLKWTTAQEQNSKNFSIEHSINGSTWTSIGILAAIVNSTVETHYSFVHASPAKGNNFYRIRQADMDDKTTVTEVREVRFTDGIAAVELAGANPVLNGALQLKVNIATVVSLYSADGKLLLIKEMPAGLQTIDVNGLAKGIYLLKSSNSTDRILIQ